MYEQMNRCDANSLKVISIVCSLAKSQEYKNFANNMPRLSALTAAFRVIIKTNEKLISPT